MIIIVEKKKQAKIQSQKIQTGVIIIIIIIMVRQ